MNIESLVSKKNKGLELTYEELEYIVTNYVDGNINDSDMTLFLKAVVDKSMTFDETSNLTTIMLSSGDKIDLSSINGIKD